MINDRIFDIVSKDKVLFNEPMKKHTSFNIGGPASVMVTVSNEEELADVIRLANEENIPYFLLGNGSNILVSDEGYRGIVIKLGGDFFDIKTEGNVIKAGAGVSLSKLAGTAMNASLSGLEFASGIPGTLGGALYMNAGAYGGEMSMVVTKVRALGFSGNVSNPDVFEFSNAQMQFGYRRSVLKEKKFIALSCEIELKQSDKELIAEYMRELAFKRKEKQPLEYPSAGSTFKRPEGYFAGKLIEDAGLGGYTIGGAQVSEKHKGFVINRGNATAKDVKDLIEYVKETVQKQTGVTLEPEILFLGKF